MADWKLRDLDRVALLASVYNREPIRVKPDVKDADVHAYQSANVQTKPYVQEAAHLRALVDAYARELGRLRGLVETAIAHLERIDPEDMVDTAPEAERV